MEIEDYDSMGESLSLISNTDRGHTQTHPDEVDSLSEFSAVPAVVMEDSDNLLEEDIIDETKIVEEVADDSIDDIVVKTSQFYGIDLVNSTS